jgi:hypothetical protein
MGIVIFGKKPYVPDWDRIYVGIAVLGAPYNFGI